MPIPRHFEQVAGVDSIVAIDIGVRFDRGRPRRRFDTFGCASFNALNMNIPFSSITSNSKPGAAPPLVNANVPTLRTPCAMKKGIPSSVFGRKLSWKTKWLVALWMSAVPVPSRMKSPPFRV